jgi:hypothetical protein
MVKVLNILFYDPAAAKWGRSKPQRATPSSATPPSPFVVAVVQFTPDETLSDAAAAARARQFGDALQGRNPAVIALNGGPHTMIRAIMALDWIRQNYAANETAPHSTLLWHSGLPVQLAEASERPQYTAINLRKFFGADCAILAANIDEDASPETRAAEAHQLANRAAVDGTTMLLFNPYNHKNGNPSPAIADLMVKVRTSNFFSEDLSVPPCGPTVWMKGANLLSTGMSQIICPDGFKSAIIATMVARAPQQLSPQPQSAASMARSGAGSEETTPTPESCKNDAAVFPSAPLGAGGGDKKRTWSIKHSSSIRVREGTDETHYDLTPYFPKAEDAVKGLSNGAFAWNVDYCILHGRLLAVHGSNADIPAFRQYMSAHPPPPRPNFVGVAGAVQQATPKELAAAADKQRRGKDPGNFSPYCLLTPTLASNRRRQWSAHRAVLLFQVTPREMRFDITELVGVGAGTLNNAVERLNGHRKKLGASTEDPAAESKEQEGGMAEMEEDLLHNYRFDYALIYSADRHGYWLLASVDVPCDIAPCRVAARALPSPVVQILQAEAGLL